MDRTLLAWVRTATSMISFGFTIYKFFQAMRDEAANQGARYLMTPRGVALVLIGLGIGSLIVATVEYRSELAAVAAGVRALYAVPPIGRRQPWR